MSFIPDSLEGRNIRISIRIKNGKIAPVKEETLPIIKDGTIADLIVPSYALERKEDKVRFLTKKTQVLPNGTILKCSLFDKEKLEINFILKEALYIEYKGDDQLGKALPCECSFKDAGGNEIVCSSLNEAYTKASQIYEPGRKSHTGNIFEKLSYPRRDDYIPLNDLRLMLQEKQAEK